MSAALLLLVLLSAATNAGWNLLAKSGDGDPLTRSAAILVGAAITAAPVLLFTGLPTREGFAFAAGSAVIHSVYVLLVGLAYRGADMSVAHPIIRGGSLILVSLCAALLFNEILPGPVWAGVIVIALGIIAMGAEAIARKGAGPATLALSFLAAVTVTGFTLVDGHGVRLSGNPAAYVLTLSIFTGLAAFVSTLIVRPGAVLAISRTMALRGLFGGFMFTWSYGIALYAMTLAPISLVSAVRETSILMGAGLAVFFLNEKFSRWRWAAAITILAGLVMTRLTHA